MNNTNSTNNELRIELRLRPGMCDGEGQVWRFTSRVGTLSTPSNVLYYDSLQEMLRVKELLLSAGWKAL
jgi:hypothetical protein